MGTGAKRRLPSTSTPVKQTRSSDFEAKIEMPKTKNPFDRSSTATSVRNPPALCSSSSSLSNPFSPPDKKLTDALGKDVAAIVSCPNQSSLSSFARTITTMTPCSKMTSVSRIQAEPGCSIVASKTQIKSSESNMDILSLFPDTPETVELFSKKVFNAEDRYKILEARDKLLRAKIPKVKMRVELAATLFGTCPDMCPEKERYMREFQRQLTPYETLVNKDQEVDHQKAIKVYSRSSADQEEPLPHELRPGKTLEMTMDYILHNIISRCENDDECLADWYNFVWDRTRSIRKDITQQQLCNMQAVSLMEKCTRFHIHCSSRLCELDRYSFDTKLNDENLMKCLQSLEHLYIDLRLKNIACPNEPEFRSYQILMNLNEGDILWEIQQKPDSILKSVPVQHALKIHHVVSSNNYVAFFRLVRESPYMTSCILHRYFFQLRSGALRSLVRSHSVNQKKDSWITASMIKRMLGYGAEEDMLFLSMCEAHGILCDQSSDRLTIRRRSFYLPETPSISREIHLIESKLTVPVAVSINGGTLAPNPLLTHVPQCSFDEEGCLIPGPIICMEPRTPSVTDGNTLPQSVTPLNQSQTLPIFSMDNVIAKPVFKFTIADPPPPSFVRPEVLQAQRIEQEVKLKAENVSATIAKILLDEYQDEQTLVVLQQSFSEAYDENLKMNSFIQSATSLISDSIFENVKREVLDSLMNNIAKQEMHSVSSQIEISKEFFTSIFKSTVEELMQSICQDELSLHIRAARTRAVKARELYNKIKLRGWVKLWRKYTARKLEERKKTEENRQKLIRDFPAGNQYGKSTAEVLSSWCSNQANSVPIVDITSLTASYEIPAFPQFSNRSSSVLIEPNDTVDYDTVKDGIFCSYEEYVKLHPGIAGNEDDDEESTTTLKSSDTLCKSNNDIRKSDSPSRKRSLPLQDETKCIDIRPSKIRCDDTDASGVIIRESSMLESANCLCQDIQKFVSSSKMERFLYNTKTNLQPLHSLSENSQVIDGGLEDVTSHDALEFNDDVDKTYQQKYVDVYCDYGMEDDEVCPEAFKNMLVKFSNKLKEEKSHWNAKFEDSCDIFLD